MQIMRVRGKRHWLKAWAGIVSVALVVAVVLSMVPVGVSFDLDGFLSIGLAEVEAKVSTGPTYEQTSGPEPMSGGGSGSQMYPKRSTNNPVLAGGGTDTWDHDKLYVSVVYNADWPEASRYRMWYGAVDASSKSVSCYAYSSDGISWTKPNLGLYTYDGSTNNNIVLPLGVYLHDAIYDGTYYYLLVGADYNMSPAGCSYIYRSSSPDGGFTKVKEVHDANSQGLETPYYPGHWNGMSLIEKPDGKWLIYTQYRDADNYRNVGLWSSDTTDITGNWTDEEVVLADNGASEQRYGIDVWHDGSKYQAAVMDYNPTTALSWFTRWESSDGEAWTKLYYWFGKGASAQWDDGLLVQGKFLEVGGDWRFYYSGGDEDHDTFPRNSGIGYMEEGDGITPTKVGEGSHNMGLTFTCGRKSFSAAGREWVFYSDGTNIVFRSREVGQADWSSATTFFSGGSRGYAFSLWWDGTKVHTVYSGTGSTGSAVLYKSGTPASAGTISWDSEETVKSGVTGKYQFYFGICLNSDGYPVVVYSRNDGGSGGTAWRVLLNKKDSGGWGTEEVVESAADTSTIRGSSVIPLASNAFLVIYHHAGTTKIRSRYYNGSAWGTAQDVATYTAEFSYSAVALGSKIVMVAYVNSEIQAFEWTADSWGAGSKIADGTIAAITKVDDSTAYAFVRYDDAVNDKLYSVKYDGSWGSATAIAALTDYTYDPNLNSDYAHTSNRISLGWMEGTADPYDVKHYAFTFEDPDPSISNTPSTYDFGTIAVSSTAQTALDHFTVTNNGTVTVDIYISGTDMTGTGGNWTLSDNATPGNMTYGLEAGLDGGSYNVTVKKTEPHNILKSSLAASATQKWGLKFYAPTAYLEGSDKSGTITLTAVASS